MNLTLKKHERLHSRKDIQKLFKEGHNLFVYPFKVIFLQEKSETDFKAQILVSVSKRSFKKAVDRNRIKRMMREAYRTNKMIVCQQLPGQNKVLKLGLIYIGKTILSYQEIERKIILILHRLNEQDGQAAG